jgi:hypothetical protein
VGLISKAGLGPSARISTLIVKPVYPAPSPALAAWTPAQDDGYLFISSLTVAEIRHGILMKPAGREATAAAGMVLGTGCSTGVIRRAGARVR